MVGEPAATLVEVLADREDRSRSIGIEELERVGDRSGGDDGEGVRVVDIDPVVVDRPGTVALPQQPVMEHLAAIDLVGIQVRDGADLGHGVDDSGEGGWHDNRLPGEGEHHRSLGRLGPGGRGIGERGRSVSAGEGRLFSRSPFPRSLP